MKNLKKLLAIGLALILALGAYGCGSSNTGSTSTGDTKAEATEQPKAEDSGTTDAASGAGKKVGVAMPTQSSQRWIQDGGNMKKELEALGYEVDLQYAEDDVQAQVSQIENMITNGANCLVIAAIDSAALVNVLQQAADNSIPVIAYDRLLMDSANVSYYATFDNKGVGTLIGQYVEEKMGLASGAGPFNIELFAGSPDDNNAHMLNAGVMEVLQPYLDSGKLVIQSGQIDFDTICTLRWSQETAQKRMEDILSGYYSSGQDVDIVISPFDGISYGIAAALEGAGYSVGEKWPLITGQDAELMACKNINSGKQTMTIFKDTRTLAEKCVSMVQAVMTGSEPEINDTTTYNNNVITVPSYLCTPVAVGKDNLQSALIDTGYYEASELEG